MFKNTVTHIFTFVERIYVSIFLFDQARPVEFLSLLAMGGWAIFLFEQPSILERDSYIGFSAMSAYQWAWLMSAVATIQLLVMFKPNGRFWHELRFVAMAASGGIWTIVASNFWHSGVSTTANFTYTSLALISALTGVYLGWKTQSYSLR